MRLLILSLLFAVAGCAHHESQAVWRQVGEMPTTAVRMPVKTAAEVPVGTFVTLDHSKRFELTRTGDGFTLSEPGHGTFAIPPDPYSDGTLKIPGHTGLAFFKDGAKTLMQVRFCYEWIATEKIE